MAYTSLLGPPELHDPTLVAQRKSQNDAVQTTSDRFVNLMVSNFNKTAVDPTPIAEMGYTEGRSSTYVSSGNPCLDFFYHTVPNASFDSIKRRIQSAWQKDPLTAFKLICNLRGVRGTGKCDKEGFYKAVIWLHQFHPRTLACNIPQIASFGYFKDLPELLYRLLEGHDVRQIQRAEWQRRKSAHPAQRCNCRRGGFRGPFRKSSRSRKTKLSVTREIRIANAVRRNEIEKEGASKLRKETKVCMAKKVYDMYNQDPNFRFLYERISDFFADCLKADVELLKSGEIKNLSLAAKWCPSLDSSFDRSLLLCESIARKVFPREAFAEYKEIEEAHYAYRIRDRLRKEVLVPLREALQLPEVYISANKWGEVPYNRVPSVAMMLHKEKFLKQDFERFSKYLRDVKFGKASIANGALLPHEVILSLNDDDGGQVAELQWKNKKGSGVQRGGKLNKSMAICDVSSNLIGTPMEASIALGLLLSDRSEKPWKGKIITFCNDPTLQVSQGGSLLEKTQFVRKMDWGNHGKDLQKVFDLILQVAVDGRLKEEEMIKRVFVFSDMEFDKASSIRNETDYQVIVRKFEEKGYGKAIPEIVFWNLRESKATPVLATQKGTALVSGFSKNLMKLFLDRDDEGSFDPVSIMEAAISGEEYQKLLVLD